MSSILPGFEYDIFISYRQKDNKHDGWVTEFVNQLQGELEATFKEDISIYFDINPHDGLLETHDVDASLKDKLKCLVFIPIISRTYCDPRSFAWEHEFKAFMELASKDYLGLKIKLTNGNVAGRVLPVRIHDLDSNDIKECELLLGSILRGIEFIYKEPGVERPLTQKDTEEKNLNRTNYRNQINKVALAIRDLINAIKHSNTVSEEKSREITKPIQVLHKRNKTKIIAGLFTTIALITLGFLFFPILFNPSEQIEKSIAVLPFKSLSTDPEKQYQADGMMDAITLHLSKIKDLRVLGRTSTEQYRNPDKTLSKIGHELEVNYILEGTYQNYAGNIKLIVQLISTGKEGHVWGNEYTKNENEIISLQSDVAKAVATELNAAITAEERQLIEKRPTSNLTAYDFYQRGKEEYERYLLDNKNISLVENAENHFKKALEYDPEFAAAYSGLAQVYWTRNSNKEYFSEEYMDSALILANIALSIDNKLSDAYFMRGNYFAQRNRAEDALREFDKAIELNPSDWSSYFMRGWIYLFLKGDLLKAFYNCHKAISVYRGEFLPYLYNALAYAYLNAGLPDQARKNFENELKLNNDSVNYYYSLTDVENASGNYEKSAELIKKAYRIDSTNLLILFYLGENCLYLNQNEDALRYYNQCLRNGIEQSYELILAGFYCELGYAYMRLGEKGKADFYLKKQIEYSNKQAETGRLTNVIIQKYWVLARTYAALGNKNEVFKYLKSVFESGIFYPSFSTDEESTPLFDSIRNEPEFIRFVKEYNSKCQTEHERVKKWLEENNML